MFLSVFWPGPWWVGTQIWPSPETWFCQPSPPLCFGNKLCTVLLVLPEIYNHLISFIVLRLISLIVWQQSTRWLISSWYASFSPFLMKSTRVVSSACFTMLFDGYRDMTCISIAVSEHSQCCTQHITDGAWRDVFHPNRLGGGAVRWKIKLPGVEGRKDAKD